MINFTRSRLQLKQVSAWVHFSLLSDFQTEKRKVYEIVRVKVARHNFTLKMLTQVCQWNTAQF